MRRRDFLAWCGWAGCTPLMAPFRAGAAEEPAAVAGNAKPRIHAEKLRLELTHTWAIARGSADYKENVLVRYERDGIAGLGEAGHLTAAGQTADQTLQGARQLIPLYERLDPLAFAEAPESASRMAGATAPARAAVEMAMLGCMVETSVAITAAVQLQSLARWADLDGNLLLKHDPFQGARIRDGRWHPTDRPGLGVRPSDRSPK